MIKDLKKTEANNGVGKDTALFIESEKTNDVTKITENYGIETNDITDYEEIARINELEKYIQGRKAEMSNAKQKFYTQKLLDDKIYDSTTSFVSENIHMQYPAEQMYIEGIESDIGSRGLEYKLKPEGTLTDVNRVLPNQIVLDYFIDKDLLVKKMKDLRFDFLKYGFAVMFEGISQDRRKIEDDGNKKFDGVFLKGRTAKKTTKIDFKLGSRVVNVDNFYIDNSVSDFSNANDCLEVEYLGRSDVLSNFVGDEYFNLSNVIKSLKDTDNEVSRYYNKREDLYAIMINDKLVYEGPIPYKHKELPYSVAVMEIDKKSPYGKGGLIKKIARLKPYINEMFNLMIKSLKMSNDSPIIQGDGVDFINESPTFGSNQTWKITGDVNQIKQLQMKGPDGGLFSVHDILMSAISKSIGYNPDSMYTMANVTQFQTGVVEEKANKRLAYYSRQIDYIVKNVLTLKLQNIHYFLDIITLEAIIDPDLKGLKKPKKKKIVLENKELVTREDNKGNKYTEFEDVPGAYSEFEMDSDSIRGEFSVRITTNDEKPLLDELRKAQYNQVVTALQVTSQVSPDTLKAIGLDIKQFWKQLLEVNNINPDNLIMDTKSKRIEEEINKELEKVSSISEGLNELELIQNGGDLGDMGLQTQDIIQPNPVTPIQ